MTIDFKRKSVTIGNKEIFIVPHQMRLLSCFSHTPQSREDIEFKFCGRLDYPFTFFTTLSSFSKKIGDKNWYEKVLKKYRFTDQVKILTMKKFHTFTPEQDKKNSSQGNLRQS